MSFSRAPLRRFNEHAACTPAPGSYEIKPGELKGAASFDKSDRFRPVKAAAGALLPPPSPSRSVLVSPVRRTLSVDGLAEGLSVKKDRNAMTVEKKQQKLLEKEIRSLVQLRGEQDRRLLALEEEMQKVEAKLLATVREKTGLAANVTTLERQRAELKKINEFLKSKVSADTTKKRINSLTMELMEARNTLDVKNKELSVLQINSDGQLKAMETDLQASRAAVSALKERNKDLEDLHQVMKTQNRELENENARLHVTPDLSFSQLEKVKQLETKLEHCMTDLEMTQDVLRQKEEEALKFHQELQASKDALCEAEKRLESQEQELKSSQKAVIDMEKQMNVANQEVYDSQATVRHQEAELARLREVLRRTEKELDERVAHLEQRCLFSEEERCKTQEEGLRRVQELKTELSLLKEAKRDEKKRQIQLQQEHAALTEELSKEKALVDSLSVLVKQEREESEEKLRHLTEEMEEVLGELAMLEDQDQKRQEMSENLQEANEELERQLKDTRALLETVPDSETEHWRQQYEELFAKVKPFQEQLNAFAAERNALLNENGVNQEELNKLADAYARLLGHQNQKQKIKHVMKLKDENISLKQEVSKLRSQVSRQKSDLEQLKSKLPGAPRRRFDPNKAFQHDKENRLTEATEPLREGNHYA
uniref:Hyaluronan-mediated motility receptor C-terminal domain-containing protein n=1 Tax=Anabas testudineus TaxID=64144 RepID=A0A7N6ABC8_ANATE